MFPRTGDLIVAELCSWDCNKANGGAWARAANGPTERHLSMRETLEQDLGRILLRAIRGAKDETSRFVALLDQRRSTSRWSLKPLNPDGAPTMPLP